MMIDSTNIQSGKNMKADVCIVGGESCVLENFEASRGVVEAYIFKTLYEVQEKIQ